jgi:UDP-N-acetylglucosamine:LPS N-acetylglucosamine transferase
MRRKNATILLAGEGGHFEQARRLYNTLTISEESEVIVFTDVLNKRIDEKLKHETLGALRDKDGFHPIGACFYFVKACMLTLAYCRKYRVSIISTGPGISLIPSLIVKVLGGKVIHIETWSRFYTKSGAGKMMYLIADRFYIQNKELSSVYPKATYAGRL